VLQLFGAYLKGRNCVIPIDLAAGPGKHLRIGWIILKKSDPPHAGQRFGAKRQVRVATAGHLSVSTDRTDWIDWQSIQLFTRDTHFLCLRSSQFKFDRKNYLTLHYPIRIAEMFPMTPKTLKSQTTTATITTTFRILFSVDCIGM
jgi:hypothetical protein